MFTPTTGWSLRTDKTFFEQASRRGSKYFTIYFLPYSSFEVAVIVPKTVARLATDRNKIKRRLKSILQKINSPKNSKLVVAVRHPATRATFAELQNELTQLISRL